MAPKEKHPLQVWQKNTAATRADIANRSDPIATQTKKIFRKSEMI